MRVVDPLALSLEKLVDVDAHEGPVYVEDEHALYFTTLPKPGPEVAITRLDLATGEIRVVREATNAANGMTLDLDGRLLVCEQGRQYSWARISRLDPLTGAIESTADTLPAIIAETMHAATSERYGRVIDHDSSASIERKKREGYF